MTRKLRLAVSNLLLLGWLLAIPSSGSLAAHASQTVPLKQSSDLFLKAWVRQDVVYLASDAEKTAYRSLASDQERYAFIERFWAQRDPTPGTTENEFRDGHYRRIDYANARFGGVEPGWQTDRGRIYITLGPPDQIEAHPSGEDKKGPFEIWIYRANSNGTPERSLEFSGDGYKLQGR